MKGMDRRNWLKCAGTVGLGAMVTPALFLKPETASASGGSNRVSKTLPMMNTSVEITVLDSSRQKAREAVEMGFAAMRDTIPLFDRFDSSGRLAHLNRSGTLRDVPPELMQVMKRSRQLGEMSDGAFDITVLPLLESYQASLEQKGHPPAPEEIEQTRELTGWSRIELGSGSVRLRSGTRITLDGIAKGYVVDAAARAIRRAGAECALINAGGDVRAVGNKDGSPWTVAIRDPQSRREIYQKVRLSDMAIATSGRYENFFDSSMRHSHLLSGESGFTPSRSLSVSVLAPSAMLADGLSTTFFISGPEKGLQLCRKLNSVETLILANGNRPFSSSGWSSLTG